MRTFKTIILLITLFGVIGCKDNKEINVITVEKYIELLKANQYESTNLPAFTYNEIPELLKYRNDTQIITNFPHNPISSLYGPECK